MEMMFNIPAKIYLAQGVSKQIGELISDEGKKKVLLICDRNIVKAGLTEAVVESLESASIETAVFDKVDGEPSYGTIEEAVAMARIEKADAVVGMGGGSALDTAKCTVIMEANQHIVRYADTFDEVEVKGMMLTLIPTTFGTGSEVTDGAVFSIPEENRKATVWGRNTGVDLALIDPELALGLPPSITASTGMDALAHAVEAYTSPMATYMSDMMAEKAINLILEYLPACVEDGENIENREKICLASLLAGIAFNNGGLNQGHELAHGLGAKFHIPHGVACSLSLPLAIKANAEYIPGRIEQLAKMFGVSDEEDKSDAIVGKLTELRKTLKIPGLHELGIDEEMFEQVGDAWDAEPKGIYPFEPDREYIIDFIRSIY